MTQREAWPSLRNKPTHRWSGLELPAELQAGIAAGALTVRMMNAFSVWLVMKQESC